MITFLGEKEGFLTLQIYLLQLKETGDRIYSLNKSYEFNNC